MSGAALIVRGQVQGVGFRPTVWRLANELGMTGDVRNTHEGVEIRIWGSEIEHFMQRLTEEVPALARIDDIDRVPISEPPPSDFEIAASSAGPMATAIAPDAATCQDCIEEVRDPFANRFRYPFTNCTNCGPRFSIICGAPYDRAKTTMSSFGLCTICESEFKDPEDRRFHAQPVACHACGPRAWIEYLGEGAVSHEAFSMLDDVDAVGGMLLKGFILAIKGVGGFHLACDATASEVVERLRQRKRRRSKAFALMARDMDVIRRYCRVTEEEASLLQSPSSPIVLLQADGEPLPESLAPGLSQLGFMLPHTPLHHLMMRRVDRPVVMTSGNISGHPQCISNEAAREQLAGVADFALMHDRDIANRIDDSVVRVDLGRTRMLRRSRGYAPSPLVLPDGFDNGTQLLAMGAELKNTFCLVKDGQAILSQHMGDLENASTSDDVGHNLSLYQNLFEFRPELIAVDGHPEYISTKRGKELAAESSLPLEEVQHHHAHVASCMVENGRPLDEGAVLGIAMDGLGMGADGTIWGGEFLLCDYTGFERLGCLKPVALPGGAAAVREPWRNAYAHLMAEMGWADLQMNYGDLSVFKRLTEVPRETLDQMIRSGTNSPLSSSCGRLFDAAAAMTGLAWDRQDYEGQAAMMFEAVIDRTAFDEPDDHIYPFNVPQLAGANIPYIEPVWAWRALLGDLILDTPVGIISARFHRGFANAIVRLAERLRRSHAVSTAVLTGGCFQNATLLELVHDGLERSGINVLTHSKTPANDGGLALGQAAVALAIHQKGGSHVSWDSRSNC
ncbi:MAG: carbamoyltransferase HypF [Alphaproteobacteria bacterium]|nr:carbamoyltransferase HypF [Alphaproteobacteria bacterium]